MLGIGNQHKNSFLLMYLLLLRLCFLQFRLLLRRIAPFLPFVTMNYLKTS